MGERRGRRRGAAVRREKGQGRGRGGMDRGRGRKGKKRKKRNTSYEGEERKEERVEERLIKMEMGEGNDSSGEE